MKKYIPNFITSLNLFSGCVAVYVAFQGQFGWAMAFILLSAVFDFFDGFAARLLRAYSVIGKELDSLADVISFGFAPGAMAFTVLQGADVPRGVALAGFLIPVFSALRLAKFNTDDRQTTSFLGLPVPANAIFWGGAIYSYAAFWTAQPWMMCALVLVFSLLLVSELPMFSLKIKSLSWRESKVQYIFLLGCAVLLALWRQDAFAFIIVWYILYSVILAGCATRQ